MKAETLKDKVQVGTRLRNNTDSDNGIEIVVTELFTNEPIEIMAPFRVMAKQVSRNGKDVKGFPRVWSLLNGWKIV